MNVASIFWAYEVVICLWRGSSVCGVCREGRLVPLFAVRSKTPKIRPQGTLSGIQSLSRLLINWQTHRWRQGRQILMLTLKWKLWQRQWLGRIYNRFNQPSTLGVWLTVLHRIKDRDQQECTSASTQLMYWHSFQLDFFSMNPAKENVRWVGDGCVCQFLRPWISFSLSVPATHIIYLFRVCFCLLFACLVQDKFQNLATWQWWPPVLLGATHEPSSSAGSRNQNRSRQLLTPRSGGRPLYSLHCYCWISSTLTNVSSLVCSAFFDSSWSLRRLSLLLLLLQTSCSRYFSSATNARSIDCPTIAFRHLLYWHLNSYFNCMCYLASSLNEGSSRSRTAEENILKQQVMESISKNTISKNTMP